MIKGQQTYCEIKNRENTAKTNLNSLFVSAKIDVPVNSVQFNKSYSMKEDE